MGLQADAVSGAVYEVRPVSGVGDDVPADGVQPLGGDAWPYGVGLGALGTQQYVVESAEVRGRLARRVHTGGVGAVAVQGRTADVDDHGVAGPDRAVGQFVVRAGAVGPGADDHEVDPNVALGDHRLRDVPADLAFGASGPQPLAHAGVHPVDGRAGPAQGGRLLRGLAHPQLVQHASGQLLVGARKYGAEGDGLLRPHVVVDAEAGRPGGQPGRDEGVGVVGLVPAGDLDAQVAGRGCLRGGFLQGRHEQEGVAVGRQDQAGQPLQRQGVVAGQVAQVRTGEISSASRPARAVASRAVRRRSAGYRFATGSAGWPGWLWSGIGASGIGSP